MLPLSCQGRPSFSTTRSLALRLRGLPACSSREAISGFLVISLTSLGGALGSVCAGRGPSLSKPVRRQSAASCSPQEDESTKQLK